MSNNNRWTTSQKSFLVYTILDFVEKGYKIQDAIKLVAKQLDIKESKVRSKWNDSLRKEYIQDLKVARKHKDNLKCNNKQMELFEPKLIKTNNSEKLISASSNNIKVSAIGEYGIIQSVPNFVQSPIKEKNKKPALTNLQTLVKSIKMLEKEKLSIINSGKDDIEYIVINNEEDRGYLVKTYNGKVINCNCPNRIYRNVICKHMIKLALDKNLEVF